MRKARKRLRNKYFSRVVSGLKSGFVPPFYLHRAGNEISLMFDRKYFNVFRPWWYDNFDNWGELDLQKEFKNHTDKSAEEIEKITGIDLEMFDKVMKSLPKRAKRVRKPRKVKEQPVRKLRNPEEYFITKPDGSKEKVIGEKVFSMEGYVFFIHRAYGHWIVSDKTLGARITNSVNYTWAVESAQEVIGKNFDKYLELLNKHIA